MHEDKRQKMNQWQARLLITTMFYFPILEASDCGEASELSGYKAAVATMKLTTGGTYRAACSDDGWTAVQSRGQYGNPEDFFYRGWDEYVSGFGTAGMQNRSYRMLEGTAHNLVF